MIIERGELKLSKNDKLQIAELQDVKIFLSLVELYNNKNIKIKKIVINKANFYFKDNDFILFNNHLHQNINTIKTYKGNLKYSDICFIEKI